jgi:hypothetical protein
MKILLRRWENSEYVWHTAKYDSAGFKVNGKTVEHQNIVSVMNDNRSNYVRCSVCDAIIKNVDSTIEKHRHRTESVNACLTCAFLTSRTSSLGKKKITYIKHSDGTYTRRTDESTSLYCSGGWHTHPIGSKEAMSECPFKACEASDMLMIVDTFTAFPGVFDDIATVNAISNVGCDFDNGYFSNGYYHYRLNIDVSNVYAAVNELGIIDHFVLKDGYFGEKNLYYSNKYDELFTNSFGGDYLLYAGESREILKENLRKLYN